MIDRVIWFARYDGELWFSLGKPDIEDGDLAGPHTTPRRAESVHAACLRVRTNLPKVNLVGSGICEPGMMGLDDEV